MSDAGDHESHSKSYTMSEIRERIPGPHHHTSPPSPSINATHQPIPDNGQDDLNYFSGPRDLQKHSKWPLMLQLHGSIMPSLILLSFARRLLGNRYHRYLQKSP
ncbi:hypothetical protein NXS19_008187 [Fusarium pseudograminearum]|nr:hypothetical protein NXS19_008187 [Fusarium pseudograminearum]